MSIRSFHLTKPFVTHLADARSAPTVLAAEARVTRIWEKGLARNVMRYIV